MPVGKVKLGIQTRLSTIPMLTFEVPEPDKMTSICVVYEKHGMQFILVQSGTQYWSIDRFVDKNGRALYSERQGTPGQRREGRHVYTTHEMRSSQVLDLIAYIDHMWTAIILELKSLAEQYREETEYDFDVPLYDELVNNDRQDIGDIEGNVEEEENGYVRLIPERIQPPAFPPGEEGEGPAHIEPLFP